LGKALRVAEPRQKKAKQPTATRRQKKMGRGEAKALRLGFAPAVQSGGAMPPAKRSGRKYKNLSIHFFYRKKEILVE
jgi:hypothetical protein